MSASSSDNFTNALFKNANDTVKNFQRKIKIGPLLGKNNMISCCYGDDGIFKLCRHFQSCEKTMKNIILLRNHVKNFHQNVNDRFTFSKTKSFQECIEYIKILQDKIKVDSLKRKIKKNKTNYINGSNSRNNININVDDTTTDNISNGSSFNWQDDLDDSDEFTQLSLFSDESLRNYSPDNDWYCLNL
jgi:hypothetical protein